MATYKQGILGPFSGKVGTVVGSSWRGISYMRSLAAKVANPRTAAQVSVRNRMAATTACLKLFNAALKVGFAPAAIGAWNAAVKANLPKAVETDGAWQLPAADIQLTSGQLTFHGNAGFSDGDIQANWNRRSDDPFAGGQTVVVIYNETQGRTAVFAAPYDSGSLVATDDNIGGQPTDKKHIYAFFATQQLSSLTFHKAV